MVVDKWKTGQQGMFNVKQKGRENTMYNQILNILRLLIFCAMILTGMILGSGCQESDPETFSQEPTAEPTTTAAPTEATEPTETEPPTVTTTPETEPPAATEPPTEPATEPPTEPIETQPPYTEEELEMLAIVIYQEAGADKCSDETRLMVGTVVMNRIADDRFPATMYEVLTQEAQYGRLHWTGIVWPDRVSDPYEAHAVERAYAIAERILLGERALPEDVVWQAEFKQGTEVVAFQDGMYFCR